MPSVRNAGEACLELNGWGMFPPLVERVSACNARTTRRALLSGKKVTFFSYKFPIIRSLLHVK